MHFLTVLQNNRLWYDLVRWEMHFVRLSLGVASCAFFINAMIMKFYGTWVFACAFVSPFEILF